jgi:hypothetical protein
MSNSKKSNQPTNVAQQLLAESKEASTTNSIENFLSKLTFTSISSKWFVY